MIDQLALHEELKWRNCRRYVDTKRGLDAVVIRNAATRHVESVCPHERGILVLCDKKSVSGQKFLEKFRVAYKFSEFEMYLQDESYEMGEKWLRGINFRKATNEDAFEIARGCYCSTLKMIYELERAIVQKGIDFYFPV